MTSFDYLVIGGGSGGIASARRAATHGAKVLLIERGQWGGTCVNAGCVPKKIMVYAAAVARSVHDAPDFGLSLDFKGLDWSQLKRKRDAAIERLRGIYQRMLTDASVETVAGSARFVDAHTVEVEGNRYSAEHILIATGSRPLVPVLPGATFGGTSDDFFWLDKQPARAMIVGSGYIAVELASTLASLGTQVSLVFRGAQLLTRFDAMLGQALGDELVKDGVEVHPNTPISSLQRGSDGLTTVCTPKGPLGRAADWVLWAIGRVPVTQGLGLQAAGIELQASGHVRVDDSQNSSTPGIYALGDVTERGGLTPVAIAAGRKLADRLFGAQPEAKLDYSDIPSVVFSHPPIGTVGLSEQQACSRFGASSIRVYESRFTNLYYALSNDRRQSHIKVVTRLPDEKVVGVHMLGLGADELIQGFAVALKMGATKADLDRTVAIHPTAAEEIVTLTRHRPGQGD